MKIKTILFDLDGTLLPMNQNKFIEAYFGSLAKKLLPFGYDSHKLINSIMEGTMKMISNEGQLTNEEVFWKTFKEIYGKGVIRDLPIFDEFYEKEFQYIQDVCGYNVLAATLVEKCKERDLMIILATNPIFPSTAIYSRIKWAGLSKDDFALITTYENSSFCKPNLKYYQEILNKFNLNPEECLMVGNDVSEDMIVTNLGMPVFLLTDNLINKDAVDITIYPNGNMNDLIKFIENL